MYRFNLQTDYEMKIYVKQFQTSNNLYKNNLQKNNFANTINEGKSLFQVKPVYVG